jgi:hypothetical protein
MTLLKVGDEGCAVLRSTAYPLAGSLRRVPAKERLRREYVVEGKRVAFVERADESANQFPNLNTRATGRLGRGGRPGFCFLYGLLT